VSVTGYTYGALAAPIAYLLFSFFIAMAIVIGAEFNSAIEELWPAHPTRRDRRRARRREMARLAARARTDSTWDRDPGSNGANQRDRRATATAKTISPDVLSPADTTHTVKLSRNGAEPSDTRAAEPPHSESAR
jgi:membrane protein